MNDLLPVERLTGPRDHFRCDAYAATISALTCLSRRAAKYEAGRHAGLPPSLHASYQTCARCPVGAVVAQRVTLAPGSACKVCGVPVRGAKGRVPLCGLHRRKVARRA